MFYTATLESRVGAFCHAQARTPAGDKPPHYIFSFRVSTIGLRLGRIRRWRVGIEV